MTDITTADEGAEALIMALLSAWSDLDDEELVPLRSTFVGIGKKHGITLDLGVRLQLEEEITMGEFRRRTRAARQRLAVQGIA